ncbi:rubredoxin [Desulfohalotomaculum tongense]|uniref:rubredoxin-like domain-containing protein n=1 Tax=Desulforadius tongensis TaxID=1216062 RepID=UPI00195830A4|nr:rubredoxin [Desulforadius tongensis]MBM7854846.1 rubredoxin [Desulforadius tongensis]
MWRCTVCNFTMEGESLPEKCPKCGAPKDKLVVLEEKQAELVKRSQKTNDLHMELAGLMDKVLVVAKEGEEDNLDPGCVKVFQTAREQAVIIKQMIKAELQGHVNKGKW